MPRQVSVLVLTLAFLWGAPLAPPQSASGQRESEQPRQVFHEVKFVSDEPLPPVADKIRAALQALPPELNKDGVEEFVERARDGWQHEGYFKVVVSNPEFKPAGADANIIDVTLHVTPGLQYKTGEITFRNNTRFTAAQLRSMIPIHRGEVFDTHKIGEGMDAMRRAYGEQGFINFTAAPSTAIDNMAETVSLDADLDEGPQFHVRKFEITGVDPETAKKLVADSGLAPGNIFHPRLFWKLCEQNTGIFPAGTVAGDCNRRVDDRAGVVDLKLELASVADEKR